MSTTETPMTLERVLKLLDLKALPGGKDLEDLVVESTAELVQRHGKEWVIRHRGLLIAQMEVLETLL